MYDFFYSNFIEANRYLFYLEGTMITLAISFGAVILGVVMGCIINYFYMCKYKVLNFIAKSYIDIIRGTPVVIQILIINLTLFSSYRNAGIYVGIVGLGLNSGAYVAEIIRAGIDSIDKGQSEASHSLGFNQLQTLKYVIAPQAVKNVLPALGNEFIVLIKETAIVGYVAAQDLTKVSQLIMGKTFNTDPLFISAFIYFIIIKILTILLRKYEAKLNASYAK